MMTEFTTRIVVDLVVCGSLVPLCWHKGGVRLRRRVETASASVAGPQGCDVDHPRDSVRLRGSGRVLFSFSKQKRDASEFCFAVWFDWYRLVWGGVEVVRWLVVVGSLVTGSTEGDLGEFFLVIRRGMGPEQARSSGCVARLSMKKWRKYGPRSPWSSAGSKKDALIQVLMSP